MFENMSQSQAIEQMRTFTAEYYDRFFKGKSPVQPGTYIPYSGRVFDEKEMQNLVESSLEFWLTSGRFTDQFEKEFAEYMGIKFCSVVNSGSSANLLAFMALTSSLLKEKRILPGDEIITVACAFPTTISPIIQYGAVPVFVDVTVPQYNLDTSLLKKALTAKTKAVMIAHTLGNPFDIAQIKMFCDKNSLWLIEDNCDALGSEYTLAGKTALTGTFGDIGTSSFYPPHHMTMGEGGAVYTNNPLLNKIVRSMRDWGRDCVCPSGTDNFCGHRFDKQYGLLPVGYDHKYVYSHFGYNLKITDMQAAIGIEQLRKLPEFIAKRRYNFDRLKNQLEEGNPGFILPEPCPNSNPSWFGFLITCPQGTNRTGVVRYLEQAGIQTRMLFAGNILKHPCFTELTDQNNRYRVVGSLETTNTILEQTFWVGVYPGMDDAAIDFMAEKIKSAYEKGGHC